jgi:hypothetical protein
MVNFIKKKKTIFGMVLGFELRASKEVLYHLNHVSSPFALVIFQIRSLIFVQA